MVRIPSFQSLGSTPVWKLISCKSHSAGKKKKDGEVNGKQALVFCTSGSVNDNISFSVDNNVY